MTDAALNDFRRRKDAHFASGAGPLKGEALEAFAGLSYYLYNPDLSFDLPVERGAQRGEGGNTVTLQTSTGEERQMQEYGHVQVPFPDGEAVLTVYAQPDDQAPRSLFLPFRDGSSGSESYGAGRYLDVPTFERDGEPWVRLDFNLAYHPYCAYDDGWTCPLPPAGNRLKTTVRAGERLA